jgi:hypothetical protein
MDSIVMQFCNNQTVKGKTALLKKMLAFLKNVVYYPISLIVPLTVAFAIGS